MHTCRLKLHTTKEQDYEIDRRFFAMFHLHNIMVKHAGKLLSRLDGNKDYRQWKQDYISVSGELSHAGLSKSQKNALTRRKKELSNNMASFRSSIGLTEAGLQKYISGCRNLQYRKLVSSSQCQKEASRVWSGVERVLFGNGQKLHFKKALDFHTIAGKNPSNGVVFDKEAMEIRWMGLSIPCVVPKKDGDYGYIMESLSHNVRYCEIERKMFPNGFHYYVIIYLDGDAPKKQKVIGDNTMGIDPGVSTIAGSSRGMVLLRELAPDVGKYNKKIRKLQQRMDCSRRASNPDNYNPDGTVKKGKKKPWVYSSTYRKNRRKLKSLYRQRSEYIKQSHGRLCNEILEDSIHIYVERMEFSSLQKRSKQPVEKSDRKVTVTKKDGSTHTVRKNKRKKRFGKSLNSRAPAGFLSILERKCLQYGGSYTENNTRTYKASQYDHTTGECTRTGLSDRWKTIGGHTVQRDLYSSFLHGHPNKDHTAPDRDSCRKDFDRFLELHDQCISNMKADGISYPACFGF